MPDEQYHPALGLTDGPAIGDRVAIHGYGDRVEYGTLAAREGSRATVRLEEKPKATVDVAWCRIGAEPLPDTIEERKAKVRAHNLAHMLDPPDIGKTGRHYEPAIRVYPSRLDAYVTL